MRSELVVLLRPNSGVTYLLRFVESDCFAFCGSGRSQVWPFYCYLVSRADGSYKVNRSLHFSSPSQSLAVFHDASYQYVVQRVRILSCSSAECFSAITVLGCTDSTVAPEKKLRMRYSKIARATYRYNPQINVKSYHLIMLLSGTTVGTSRFTRETAKGSVSASSNVLDQEYIGQSCFDTEFVDLSCPFY